MLQGGPILMTKGETLLHKHNSRDAFTVHLNVKSTQMLSEPDLPI